MRISDWSSDVCSSDLPYVRISQFASAYYFAHFLIVLPLIARIEKPLPLPNSISESVLHGERREAAPIGAASASAAEEGGIETKVQIGRAACRERVGQSV